MKRILLLVAALAAACAHAPEPSPVVEPAPPPVPAIPPDEATLARIRADVEALLTAQGEATWTSWTSGSPLDVAGPLRGREWLADGGALRALDAIPAAADPAEAARRRTLRDFLVGERLAARAAPSRDATPPDLTFSWDGRTVALRDGASLLAAEPDAARRAALDLARAPAAARSARAADADADALARASVELGLGELPALAAGLRRSSPAALTALASATLDATGPAYCAAMDALARQELGVAFAATHARDLPRILRASHEPRAHPAANLVPDGRAAAQAAGIDLATRVRLDDRPASGKSQRPLAVPVRVPDDVRLSALPSGGASESRAFLHELGVALFLSSIRAQPLEARRLGTPAAAATWGFFFEALDSDPAWSHDRSGITGHALGREMKASQATRLHAARMAAARLLRELERSRAGVAGADGDARVLSRVLCRKVNAEEAARWPIARDPLLTSADALRAMLLAAQIEATLAAEGGGPWWRWNGAPAWLAARFAPGSPATVEDLAAAVGVGTLSPEPLARAARARFEAAGW